MRKKILKEWTNREIIFPNLETKYMGKDTILPNMLNHEFKILHYIDTIGCTNCHLQLFDWKLYMKELKSSSIDIALIFVVFTKNYEEFEIIQRNNHFFYPVIYDYNGLLNKKNQGAVIIKVRGTRFAIGKEIAVPSGKFWIPIPRAKIKAGK